jgi:hypothetical protein
LEKADWEVVSCPRAFRVSSLSWEEQRKAEGGKRGRKTRIKLTFPLFVSPRSCSVPPDMTPAALDARIVQHLNIDWELVGTERMKERGWKEVTLAKHLIPSIGKPRFRKEV